ncbi:N-6 DNA methylase [Streptomyces venezuelae]|uniref:N-6 DNA methylase n=1 Tax=Streptomyces venezuelae TaxID=54571 RepID=UPI00278C429B|nr:N-6 DNA methylase [Streptomyces venezuelae]
MNSSPGSTRYLEHAAHIDGVLGGLQTSGDLPRGQVDSLLDGHSAAELRRLVPLSYRRQVGAFFTPSNLKTRVTDVLRGLPGDSFLDPACGAGDLLLAAADVLPIGSTLSETLKTWGGSLHGWDLHKEFTETARRRILLSAINRHHSQDGKVHKISDLQSLFGNIKQSDAHRQGQIRVDAVVLNPPFTPVRVPRECGWAQGKTSNAAVFFLDSLRHVKPAGHIIAILPDSLRSGTNFTKWRALVESLTDVTHVERLGVFDPHTDIDVFLLVAQVRETSASERNSVAWWSKLPAGETVGNLYEVRVGTVVDNRDPHEGSSRPFLTARDLPSGSSMGIPERRRQFNGRLFSPPFVAIRRTSRPSEGTAFRAAGVLVTGGEEVAVDNHLIVAKPRKGGVKACKALIKTLNTPLTNEILDDRISCRHLTVSAIKDIPFGTAGG